jgi:hypothetical protein
LTGFPFAQSPTNAGIARRSSSMTGASIRP